MAETQQARWVEYLPDGKEIDLGTGTLYARPLGGDWTGRYLYQHSNLCMCPTCGFVWMRVFVSGNHGWSASHRYCREHAAANKYYVYPYLYDLFFSSEQPKGQEYDCYPDAVLKDILLFFYEEALRLNK